MPRKVKILPSGEIVGEDDPRFNSSQNRTQRPSTSRPSPSANPPPRQQQFGRIGAAQEQAPASPFEQANQKLVELGIPALSLGAYNFEPIWLVLAVISLYFFGIPALILLGIFYMIRRSETQPAPAAGGRPRTTPGGGRTLGR